MRDTFVVGPFNAKNAQARPARNKDDISGTFSVSLLLFNPCPSSKFEEVFVGDAGYWERY